MLKMFGAAVLACLSFFSGVAPVSAQKKLALVIGIDSYPQLPAGQQLKKAVNDARTMGQTLRDIGFTVELLENASREALNAALDRLESRITEGDIVFFFFAGHGVSIDTKNFLLPGDVRLRDAENRPISRRSMENDLAGYNAAKIVGDLKGRGARVVVAVLDACRDAPFDAQLTRSFGVSRGLDKMAPPKGVFVLFSAGEKQRALDGLSANDPNPNSVFTRLFAPLLRQPGLTMIDIAKRLQPEVQTLALQAGEDQVPAYYDEVIGHVVLVPGAPPAPAPAPPPVAAAPPAPSPEALAELQAWEGLKTSADLEAVRRFAATARNPSLRLAAQARAAQLASVAPPPAPPSPAPRPPVQAVLDPARPAAPLSPADLRSLRLRDVFRECPECPEVVVIPAGQFLMGGTDAEPDSQRDEVPRHRVTIPQPLAVGRFEVTFAEWDACVAGGGCQGPAPADAGWGRGRQPVINVSWRQAQAYAQWLSRRTGRTYRLLTEAEWEYAARAGTTTPYAFGATVSTDEANYDGALAVVNGRKGAYRGRTTPVGSFRPNAFGLFDMHGNVWEWVEDCYRDNYTDAPADGRAVGGPQCERRVLRGGSWTNDPNGLRSAFRNNEAPDTRANIAGFRIVRVLGQ